jgi:hypothetical protein
MDVSKNRDKWRNLMKVLTNHQVSQELKEHEE